MLYLLSPAKSLNWDDPVPPEVLSLATAPSFMPHAAQLVDLLRQLSVKQLGTLMTLSPSLAQLNWDRYQTWRPNHSNHQSKPAVLAFSGDVYTGLNAASLSVKALQWAQEHLLILSGLYGALRPLDWLRPYRLEMGTTLTNPRGRDLYAFWGDTLAKHVNAAAAATTSPVVVNLASQEYFRSVNNSALQPRVIDCVFEDWKSTGYRVIGFFAKRARGMMARYVIENRINAPSGLKDFSAAGYVYDTEASAPDRFVFRRRLG